MEQETRAEINGLHDRITKVVERVVVLETQQPHMGESLGRIEGKVDRIGGYVSKLAWLIIALFVAALFKLVASGSIHLP